MKTFAWGVLLAGLCAASAATAVGEDEPVVSEDLRKQAVNVLRAGLNSDEFWPAMHAAEGLTLAGHGDEVIAALEPRLAEETDDQRRCGLARELVRAGRPGAARVMLEILAGEDDHGHVHAAESLYKVKQTGDGRALRRAFDKDNDSRLKLMAAGALAQHGDEAARDHLRKTLGNDDPALAQVAAWILGVIGDRTDILRIRRNLDRSQDELTRAYHEHALALLGDKVGQKALLRNLSSSDPAVRTFAANFAGDAGMSESIPVLAELLNDPHLDVRIRAAQSLVVLSGQEN